MQTKPRAYLLVERIKQNSPRYVGSVRVPTPATLRKYGLDEAQWLVILKRQKYSCGVCGKVPASGTLHIDHYHRRNYKKLVPADKRLYIRGLACATCNRVWLRKGATPEKLRSAASYLKSYEKRLKASLKKD